MKKSDVVTLFLGIFIGLILLSMYLGRVDWNISSSVIVAICALFLTVWQSISVRKHNIISVKPKLKFSSTRGDDSWELRLENLGLGPAFIYDLELQLNDELVDADEFNKYFKNRFKDGGGEVRVKLNGYAIPANNGVTLVVVGFSRNETIGEELTKIVGMSVKYTSSYGEEFIESSSD